MRDSDILEKFRKSSLASGERLVLYAELKKRGLLAALNDENPLLFRGTAPMGETGETAGVIVGCLAIGMICMQFERSFLLALIAYLMILLPFLNMLNLFLYRVTLIYPDRITIATCLCFDTSQLKSKTIKFGGHGLYINAFAHAPFIHPLIFPHKACLYFRAVPDVEPLLQCTLTVKMVNNLLNQLSTFFKGIGQDVFMASASPGIHFDESRPSTDLEAFCLKLAEDPDRPVSTADDPNWLRLIAEASGRPIAEDLKSRPLSAPPEWLEPGERLVLCLNGFLVGFRKKGYLCFTTDRIVRTTLSGEYFDGVAYDDQALKLIADPNSWRVDYNANITGQKMDRPYPIFAVADFFKNRKISLAATEKAS